MKKFYNVAEGKDQPCEPVWKDLYFVGMLAADEFSFHVYYDPEKNRILDFAEPLEEKL